MIPYFIEAVIVHCLLSFVYILFLHREVHYSFRRSYLLLSILLAILTPIFSTRIFDFTSPDKEQVVSSDLLTIALNPMVIGTQTAVEEISLISWIYWAGAALFFLAFIIGILKIILIYLKSQPIPNSGMTIQMVEGMDNSFTFFNWIFVGSMQSEISPILEHEKAHARLLHSLDLIITQLFRTFFWFLPTAWWVNTEMKKIHEYQADRHALKNYDLTDYSNLLISNTLKTNGLSLANSFHDGLTIKRLNEMKKQFYKVKKWKMAIVSTLCSLIIITFACNDQLDAEIQKMGENATEVWEIPQESMGIYNQLSEKHGKENIKYIEIIPADGADKTASLNKQLKENQIYANLVLAVNVLKDENRLGIFFKEGKELDHVNNKLMQMREPNEDVVFTMVEDQPEFPGGISAFYEYIGENLKYPALAKELGVEGRVFVQFVIDKDGSVTEVQSVKGIGSGCDQEAVRVMESAPNFIPGRQRDQAVKVRMVLPIVFKLDQTSSQAVR